jgi:hypothetical protein
VNWLTIKKICDDLSTLKIKTLSAASETESWLNPFLMPRGLLSANGWNILARCLEWRRLLFHPTTPVPTALTVGKKLKSR